MAALKLEEREEISRGIAAGRFVSVGSHEVSNVIAIDDKPGRILRNGGSQTYRANRAERSAWGAAMRWNLVRLALHGEWPTARGAEACAAMGRQ